MCVNQSGFDVSLKFYIGSKNVGQKKIIGIYSMSHTFMDEIS